ncbi:MAG: tetraacyldisaccharide 4'-kinase [Bacteroidales bacterium]|nr:tetraacyldisaccharide 4'-kinase [Bacteroidales bacterium]
MIRRLLSFPISVVWALIMSNRRNFYNSNSEKRRVKFNKPVISVGNLCMGGSGKTPHIEYLVRLLGGNYQLAVLSRGYGRFTKGFLFADSTSTSKTIGDEPLLYYKKYSHIAVSVCENRVEGLKTIWEKLPEIKAVLLDDAHQHLSLKPGLSILLTDYYHLYPDDFVFPSGNLREPASAAKEADIIVITKSPTVISPIDERVILDKIKPLAHQKVCFSFLRYGNLIPLTSVANTQMEEPKSVVVFTGIYNSYPLITHLKEKYKDIQIYTCRDHHKFTIADIEKVKYLLSRSISHHKAIITTEKDATRLLDPSLKDMIQMLPIYYIPIVVDFHQKYKEDFNNQILEYVESYK